MKQASKRSIFPLRVALLLILPSLALYLFFNTWPMIFSIGIAFTNATRENILPNPDRIKSLENAIACAKTLRDNPEYRSKMASLYNDLTRQVDGLIYSFNQTITMIERGENPAETNIFYVDDLSKNVSNTAKRISRSIQSFFDCSSLGYPTGEMLTPSSILDKLDRLSALSGKINAENLYNISLRGLNITLSLKEDLALFQNPELYFNSSIQRFQEDLDRLELKYVGGSNFARLFGDPRFYYSLYKTLLFVATSVPLKVGLGVLLAIFYSSRYIIGRKGLRALILVPWAMPFLLSAITWRYLFLPNGQLGQFFGLNMNSNEWHAFLIYNLFEAWLAYPFIMTVTQGALSGISKDVIEAAYVDGASVWTVTRRIMLPLISRPLLVATALTTGASLQAFMIPLVLNGGGPTGMIRVPFLDATAYGPLNEMLILFGYNKITNPTEGFDFGYGASIYLVILAIILSYVFVLYKLMKRFGYRE